MTDLDDIVADLAAEQQALDDALRSAADDTWETPTASPGWTVADQIGHLTFFDRAAVLAVGGGEAWEAHLQHALTSMSSVEEMDDFTLAEFRAMRPAELRLAWRDARQRLAVVASTVDPGTRIPWYGPPMGARSFLTARLMECWAHGQDCVDALDLDRPVTDRLRHVCHLGVITRGWAYRNRGLDVPSTEVRVELTLPSGAPWSAGPDDVDDHVRGSAEDFCLVVTQRRHVDDTALEVEGHAAREWMGLAQAFAGPPTDIGGVRPT